MRTNDELSALVLPWTYEQHRDWYDATIAVAAKEKIFRGYLLRLVERRVEEEPGFIRTVPLSVLDETAIVRVVKFRGVDVEVKGRKAEGPHQVTWVQLNQNADVFQAWLETIDMFDLEVV
jgi:hypothetical protein